MKQESASRLGKHPSAGYALLRLLSRLESDERIPSSSWRMPSGRWAYTWLEATKVIARF